MTNYIICIRIRVQDKVRALKRQPREEDRNIVEIERAHIRVQLDHFHTLGAQTGLNLVMAAQQLAPDLSVTAFDELEVEPADEDLPPGQVWAATADSVMSDRPNDVELTSAAAAAGPEEEPVFGPPENVSLPLPSTTAGNVVLGAVELRLREAQAVRYLDNLRELIAEKSFLYSHVIRVAPRKVVRTRARANIAKLNLSITHLCRAYSKSRMLMIRLGADDVKHPILLREHVRASTAILNPNEPGSTKLQLSWIWQVAGEHIDRPGTLGECK